MLLGNLDDPEFMKRVDPFLRTLIADARQHGYGEYRAHIDYMDLVSDCYDYNHHALLQTQRAREERSWIPPASSRPARARHLAGGLPQGRQGA